MRKDKIPGPCIAHGISCRKKYPDVKQWDYIAVKKLYGWMCPELQNILRSVSLIFPAPPEPEHELELINRFYRPLFSLRSYGWNNVKRLVADLGSPLRGHEERLEIVKTIMEIIEPERIGKIISATAAKRMFRKAKKSNA